MWTTLYLYMKRSGWARGGLVETGGEKKRGNWKKRKEKKTNSYRHSLPPMPNTGVATNCEAMIDASLLSWILTIINRGSGPDASPSLALGLLALRRSFRTQTDVWRDWTILLNMQSFDDFGDEGLKIRGSRMVAAGTRERGRMRWNWKLKGGISLTWHGHIEGRIAFYVL